MFKLDLPFKPLLPERPTHHLVMPDLVVPPPVPEKYSSYRCLYGYELLDELVANYDCPRDSQRALDVHLKIALLRDALCQLGIPPILARVDRVDSSRIFYHTDADCSPHDVVYFALNLTQPPPAVCLTEEKLAELSNMLNTEIRAKWIPIHTNVTRFTYAKPYEEPQLQVPSATVTVSQI